METRIRTLWWGMIVCIFVTITTSLDLYAQKVITKRVTGVVKTEEGIAAPGVAVLIKGTSNGTLTDVNGRFSLNVNFKDEKEKPVLVFSCLGMKTQELPCMESAYAVVMSEEYSTLTGAVINTGYQKMDRRLSASSVTSISGAEILQTNATSLDNMLQGKVAGLSVLSSSSTPGAATKVRIRGTSTISGNREPLWVIDGIIQEEPVKVPTEVLNDLDNVNLLGNAISGLNPMDIESIDVLKDASATAIYGVRAANGVIVVTTKKGKLGKPRVSYSGSVTLTERPSYNRLHLMNSKERIEVSKEIENKGLVFTLEPARVGYEGLLFDWYDRKLSTDEFLHKVKILEETNTDWFDLLFENAVSHKHNLSISGANDKVNYYVSAAFNDENANVKGTGLNQCNVLAKVNVKLSNNLTGNIQVRGNLTDKKYVYSGISPYSYAYNTSRAIPALDEHGNKVFYNARQGFGTSVLKYNILNELENSGRSIKTDAIYFNSNLEWHINDNFRLSGIFALNTSNTGDKEWFSENSFEASSLRLLDVGQPFPTNPYWKNQCRLPYGGMLKTDFTRNYSYMGRSQMDFNKYFKGHHFSVSAGFEVRSVKYSGQNVKKWGYLPERGETFVNINASEWPAYNNMLMNSASTPFLVRNSVSNFLSTYAVLSYSYKSRYIFNANIRADGSNKFGQDKKARFLPIWSLSTRWNLMNEKFLKNVMWLNELSLKCSYGIQGNVSDDQVPSLLVNIGSLDGISGDYMSTLSKLPNPQLRWEKTNSYNVALDFALFNNRLSGTMEYYYKYGSNQIVSVEVSQTTGMNSMSINAGDIMNKGYEFVLNAVPVQTKDFRWSLSFNAAKNINKVTKGGMQSEYDYMDYLNGNAILVGSSLNSFYSYKFDKLDEKGLPLFKDIEETEGATKKSMLEKAFAYSGKRLPDFQGGFGMNFSYKDLSLGLFFSYSLGSKVRLNNLYNNYGQQLPNPQQNMSAEFVNRWRKPGDEEWAVIPALSNERLPMTGYGQPRRITIANNMWQMYNQSDIRVVSGDFLRLRTAFVKYALPEQICKKVKIAGASMRVEGNNLFLLCSKKLNGQDPEQLGLGTIGFTTPPVSFFSFGLDVSF